MHPFCFSLLAMFGFVAVVAVACAALARPSQVWLVVVSASSLACLFYAVLAAAYPPASACKSASQFLKSRDPQFGMLRRFAKAVGMPLEKLIGGK